MQRILPKPNAAAIVSVDHALASGISFPDVQTEAPTYIIIPVTTFTQNIGTAACNSHSNTTSANKCDDSLVVHRRKRLHTTKENSENFSGDASPNFRLKSGRLPCKRCSRSTDEPCLKHAFAIKDLPTLPKAYASLPAELYVAQKDERMGSYHVGVFAKTAISHPTVFGPLVAPVKNDASPSQHRFALRERNGNSKNLQVFDLDCDDLCNWMKFVRKAVDGDQQNVVAFCDKSDIYFATTKDIPADTELRFCYSQQYSKLMRRGNIVQQDVQYMHLPEPDENEYDPVLENMQTETADENSHEFEISEDEACASVPLDSDTVKRPKNESSHVFGNMTSEDNDQNIVEDMIPVITVGQLLDGHQNLKPKRFRSFKCTAGCDLRFRIKKSRDIHSMRHREGECIDDKQVAECPECDFKASTWIDLLDHIDSVHHVVNPLTPCPKNESGKITSEEDAVDLVPVITVGQLLEGQQNLKPKKFRSFKCAAGCDLRFRIKKLRDIHAMRHREGDCSIDKQVAECQCDFKASTWIDLLDHIDDVHQVVNPSTPCPKNESGKMTSEEDAEDIIPRITVGQLLGDQQNLKPKRFRSKKCTGGCDLRFRTKKLRDIHSTRHREGDCSTDEQVAECPECDFKAPTWIDLLDHIDGLHQVVNPSILEAASDPAKCTKKRKYVRTGSCNHPRCRYIFGTEKLRDLHALRHNASQSGDIGFIRECPECHLSTEDLDALIFHVEKAHSLANRRKKKIKLSKGSTTTRNLIRRWSSCTECSLQFRTKKLLDLHALQHTGFPSSDSRKIYRCVGTSCSFSSEDMDELFRHVVERHGHREGHYCSRCNTTFTTLKRLERHIQRIHIWSDSEKPFECETCHKKFSEKSSFTRHLGVHAGPNYISCCVCTATFPSKTALIGHLVEIHAVDGLVSCGVCGKSYSTGSKEALRAFRNHGRIHAEGGHFECEICKKVFKHHYKLLSHKEVHRDTRDYVCECGKSFARSANLSQHRRVVHKEGKIIQTTYAVCGKPSSENKAKDRTGYVPPQKFKDYTEFPYFCEECRQGFCRRGMLAYHFTVRHPERSLESVPQLTMSGSAVHLNQG